MVLAHVITHLSINKLFRLINCANKQCWHGLMKLWLHLCCMARPLHIIAIFICDRIQVKRGQIDVIMSKKNNNMCQYSHGVLDWLHRYHTISNICKHTNKPFSRIFHLCFPIFIDNPSIHSSIHMWYTYECIPDGSRRSKKWYDVSVVCRLWLSSLTPYSYSKEKRIGRVTLWSIIQFVRCFSVWRAAIHPFWSWPARLVLSKIGLGKEAAGLSWIASTASWKRFQTPETKFRTACDRCVPKWSSPNESALHSQSLPHLKALHEAGKKILNE